MNGVSNIICNLEKSNCIIKPLLSPTSLFKYLSCDIPTTAKKKLKITDDNFAPFITASFDIECDSSHGDFPNPIKDLKKLSIDIYETYFRQSICEIPYNLQISSIRAWIEITFNGGDNDIQSTYTENGVPTTESIDDIMKIFTETYLEDFKASKSNNKLRDKTITDLLLVFSHHIHF